ncbi:unnamed protein product, partial [Rotaria sordida]
MGFTPMIYPCLSIMSYNTLAELNSINGTWDIIISDITITSNRLLTVDFSVPIYETAIRVIVRDSSPISVNFLSYLRPFSLEVWLSIIGIVIYSGLLVFLFERRTIEETQDCRGLRAIIFGVYQALSTVIGMGSDLPLRTKSSRIIVIGLFTLSVLLVATYTANLSSYLTLQRTQPPISGIDDIKNGRLRFDRIGVLSNSAIEEFYTSYISNEFYPVKSVPDIYTLLLNNYIDAALGDALSIEYAVDRHYCGNLSVIGVGFAKSTYGIVMAKNWRYKLDLDVNIVTLRESGELESLEQKWFSKRTCNNITNVEKIWERDGISFTVIGGLFISFLIVSAIAITLH